MSENEELYNLEQMLFNGAKTHRQTEIARRQILKYNPTINNDELERLLKKDVIIVEKVKECILEDLAEFAKRINTIENEINPEVKRELMESLLFDFKLRITDIIDLIERLDI